MSFTGKLKAMIIAATAAAALLSAPASARMISATKATAKAAIVRELKSGKGDYSFIRVKMSEPEAERIISEIEREKFRLWRGEPVSYLRQWISETTWFEGFAVRPRKGGRLMEINRLLDAKAKKIVSKKVKKGMSQKKKAKAIASGTASLLKYGMYDRRNEEASTLRNLKKNRGYCLIYALVYQAACEKAGLQCRVAYGRADGDEHAWNKVRVGGKWRYVDACWYDGARSSKYVLSKRLWPSHKLRGLSTYWE